MTPSEMLQKYKDTGRADFLSELQKDELWAFLLMHVQDVCRPISDVTEPYDMDRTYDAYDEFHLLVVQEAKAEYAAQEDVWGAENAGVQHIREHRQRWLHWLRWAETSELEPEPQKALREIIEALQEL